MAKRGIDISAHQGDIDLGALQSQIDFVIIRVGYGTKGSIDNKFKRNTDLCEQLGIPYGFYWYSYALDTNGAEAEANAFLSAIAPYNPTYGCWFDMEDADGYKKKNGMPSNDTLKEICYKFCETVENVGYYSGIYASESWLNNQLSGDRLARFDKWVAQWPTSGGRQKALNVNADSRSGLSLWQFTSNGRFDGYSGNLDTNYAYKEFTNPGRQSTPQAQPESVTPDGSTLDLVVGVMNGQYGDGDARKSALGTRYDEVQNFINHVASASVDTLAQEVMNGQYGDGNIRKLVLNDRYNEVQNKVNEMAQSSNDTSIDKGDRVRFTGTKSYSGIHLASWTHNDIFNVIETSGDRIIIGKGTAVTAAVKASDCQKI